MAWAIVWSERASAQAARVRSLQREAARIRGLRPIRRV